MEPRDMIFVIERPGVVYVVNAGYAPALAKDYVEVRSGGVWIKREMIEQSS